MALPSQMERNSSGGAVSGRSSRRMTQPAAKIAMIAGGVVVLGLVTWGIVGLLSGGGPQNAGATQPNDQTPKEVAKETPNPTREGTSAPPPISITQGGMNNTRPLPVDVTQGNLPSGAPGAGANPTGTSPTGPIGTTPGGTGDDMVPTSGSTPTTPAPTPSVATPPVADALTPTASTSEVQRLISEGDRQLAAGKLVEARRTLSRALLHRDAASSDKQSLRTKLTTINDDLVFSTKVTPGDPLVEAYKVEAGDSLVKIRRKRDLATDWRLIQRVNKMSNPNALKIGQTLKLVRGPFHAVVTKSEYRLDLFTGSPDEPDQWMFVKSYRVGLGEGNSTPVGTYVIKKNSKLVNPHWVNPRTGERFDKDDPKNPIGEYWLGWQGVGASAVNTGYGLHGTIEPDSIGQQRSMGCVRLGTEDIAQIYDLLVEEVSIVKVQP